MTRRVGALAIALVALLVRAQGGSGQAVFPPQLEPRPGGAAGPEGLVPNGYRVDPYTRSVDAREDECDTVRVAGWALRDRCGDDDGCDIRLVFDRLLDRIVATTRSFVTDRSVERWFASTSLVGGSDGINGDGAKTEAIRIEFTPNAYCSFYDDDSGDQGVYFHLEACAGLVDVVFCALRVAD